MIYCTLSCPVTCTVAAVCVMELRIASHVQGSMHTHSTASLMSRVYMFLFQMI